MSGSTTDQSFRGTIYWCSPEHIKKDDPTYVFDIWFVNSKLVYISLRVTKCSGFELM